MQKPVLCPIRVIIIACHAGLSRWQRIALVRELANAKVQDGDSTVSARYARERKHSALELLEKARHKARDIFDRQVGYLPYTWTVLTDQQACCCMSGLGLTFT